MAPKLHFLLLIFVSILIVVEAGCGRSTIPDIEAVELPERFEESSRTWVKATVSSSDDSALEQYLESSPGIVDNPLLRGKRVKYEADSGDRRFYFVSTISGGDPTWLLFEFDKQGVFRLLSEGSGEPFQ